MGVIDGENEGEGGRGVSKEEKQPFVCFVFFHWQVVTGDGWSAEQVSANAKSRNLLLPCLCGVSWRTEA